jgi:hypothetical protein
MPSTGHAARGKRSRWPAIEAGLKTVYRAVTGSRMRWRGGAGPGLVAVRLLVTKGWNPETAVQTLSAARGAAVPETAEQRRWIDRYAAILAGAK